MLLHPLSSLFKALKRNFHVFSGLLALNSYGFKQTFKPQLSDEQKKPKNSMDIDLTRRPCKIPAQFAIEKPTLHKKAIA